MRTLKNYMVDAYLAGDTSDIPEYLLAAVKDLAARRNVQPLFAPTIDLPADASEDEEPITVADEE